MQRPRSAGRLTGAVVLTGLIGLVDYGTGVDLRVYPFYFLPVAAGGWLAGRAGAISVSVLCSLAWAGSNFLAGLEFTHKAMWAANSIMQLSAFLVIGLLSARMRHVSDEDKRLARTDHLTLLLNARGFYERVASEIDRARRTGTPITVACLDLDNFKEVNDRFGHQKGDHVLCTIADCLQTACRSEDVLARIGGDEFALCLPNTGSDEAGRVLEGCRAIIENATARENWPVTASIGAGTIAGPVNGVDELLRHADAMMYDAKVNGKNKVQLAFVKADGSG